MAQTLTGLSNSQKILEDALTAMADVGPASIGTRALDNARGVVLDMAAPVTFPQPLPNNGSFSLAL
ncbi:hypothetical protein [Nocardia sp. NPDC019395]|uniref:hypothetical protein n=1 Tax=Nocardia sp. NPDC019395 TaxID=3154686 RepID=UPI0033F9A61A